MRKQITLFTCLCLRGNDLQATNQIDIKMLEKYDT